MKEVTLKSIEMLRGKIILIVDDEPDGLGALEEILDGYNSPRN